MPNSSDFWEIPRLWPDSTVFIIGGGPSVADVDLTKLHDKRVIGVNMAYKLGPWVDVCWFGDKKWYVSQVPAIREFNGLILTCAAEARRDKRWKRVKYLGRSKPRGLELKRNTHVAWNGNSGTSAINVAYHLGAKRVILLGFEQQLPEDRGADTQTHWHRDYELRRDGKTGKLVDPYPNYLKHWKAVAADARVGGLEILNATPVSAIEAIEKVNLEDVL